MASSARSASTNTGFSLWTMRETIEDWRIDYNQVRPHSALGYLTPEEFATGHANVESKKRFPHSHSLDCCCGLNLQLNSNPSALTCAD